MPFAIWSLIIGALLITMALSGTLLRRLPLGTAMLYLAAGFGLGPAGLALMAPDPLVYSVMLERSAEIAVLISLFAVGFGGSIDEVAIFNRALSAAEIAAMYQRALNGSVSPSQGSCGHIGQVVTCNLGTIASLGSASVELVATATSAGVKINTASVNSNTTDPGPANNTATQSTTVVPACYLPLVIKG